MRYYSEIEGQGVQLYAVSVDPPEASEALRRRLECDFTFLSDRDGKLLDLLNIRHRQGRMDGGDIAYPAQVLVDKDGIVRWTFSSDNYRVRAKPEDVFAAIERLEG
jgi:peroxiredoxin